jgi:hypothetical protein
LAAVATVGQWHAIRIIRHPLMVIGLVITLPWVLIASNSGPLNHYQALTLLPGLLLGPMAFFASNLAASRDRRAGSNELIAATPVDARTRTAGALAGTIGPAALSAATVILVNLTAGTQIDGTHQTTLAEQAIQPVTVLAAGLLGVMTARWLPWTGGAAIVMIGLVAWVATASFQFRHPTAQVLAPMTELDINNGRDIVGYLPIAVHWHLIYLLCLAALAAIGALITTPGPRRGLIVAAILTITLTIGSGWQQLP